MLSTDTHESSKQHILRERWKSYEKCPMCGQKIEIAIDPKYIENRSHYPYKHIIIHGKPLHALELYIDKNGAVRGMDATESVQFDRKSQTFEEFMKLWSNPF